MEKDSNNSRSNSSDSSEPAVRSRWTPKPEQILILESIFNSGMVNPPKEETVRIRKLLEKFGSVGDANVFYWFQNRRSRSRRRQRQIQATLEVQHRTHLQEQLAGANISDHNALIATETNMVGDYLPNSSAAPFTLLGNSSSPSFRGVLGDDETSADLFQVSGKMGFSGVDQNSALPSVLYPPEASDMHFQSGFITVFINGLPTEVPKGPIDLKPMFGQDVILVHSSGVPLPTNEFGILLHCLQPGESYFLVPRPPIISN